MSKLVFIKIKTHHGTEFDDLSENLKDYLRRKYPEDTIKNYNNSAGLVPELGRVICITLGYELSDDAVEPGSNKVVTLTYSGIDERSLLIELSSTLVNINDKGYKLTGWNNNHFDAVYLMKRYLINELKVPTLLYNSLRWSPKDTKNPDIMDIWRLGENPVSLELASLSIGNNFQERYDISQLKLEDIDFNKLKTECESDVKSIINLNNIISKYLW